MWCSQTNTQVQSAYFLGVALLEQLGRSLMYIKKSNGRKINLRDSTSDLDRTGYISINTTTSATFN